MYASALATVAILAGAGSARPPVQLAQADCILTPTPMSLDVRAQSRDSHPVQLLAMPRCWRPIVR